MTKERWLHLGAGLAGGLLGTRLMLSTMKRAGKLPPSLRPPAPSENPAEFMLKKGERLVGPLPPRLHQAIASSLDWLYGIVWPLGLSALVAPLGLRSTRRLLAAGAGLGALVWAVGALGWLPATGLTPPVYRQPIRGAVTNLFGHLAYGTVAALPLIAVENERIKERIS